MLYMCVNGCICVWVYVFYMCVFVYGCMCYICVCTQIRIIKIYGNQRVAIVMISLFEKVVFNAQLIYLLIDLVNIKKGGH